MKTFLILTAFLSSSLAVAAQFECATFPAGETLNLRVKKREEIKPAAVAGITISTSSEKLMPDTTGGASYEILAYALDVKAEHTAFDRWDGNWGMRIDVPNGALSSDVKAGTNFNVGYYYVYGNGQDESVTHTLHCVAQ